MITNELRLGNWVTGRNDPPMQVAAISKGTVELYMPDSEADNFAYDEKEINPIKITDEVLNKCGFEYYHNNKSWQLDINYGCSIWGRDGEFHLQGEFSGEMGQAINHLHQLQNIYFSLTGHELPFHGIPPPTGAIATEAK